MHVVEFGPIIVKTETLDLRILEGVFKEGAGVMCNVQKTAAGAVFAVRTITVADKFCLINVSKQIAGVEAVVIIGSTVAQGVGLVVQHALHKIKLLQTVRGALSMLRFCPRGAGHPLRVRK